MTDRSIAGLRRTLAAALLAGTALVGGLTATSAPAVAAIAPSALPASGFADLVEQISPAVVTVMAVKDEGETMQMGELPPGMEEFLRRFGGPGMQFRGGPSQPEKARSLGSGFIFDSAGFVVTNRHVIDGADEVSVTLQDGRELKATIVGDDDKTDLAVLKVESDKSLPSLAFADSDKVRVGDVVIAVGNPFGLGGTVTAGIVSARGRSIGSGPFDDFIQVDAAINRGNSGGPTFNAAGEVVGINTAIFSPNGGSVGIGFAIPSNIVKPVVEQLKAEGKVDRGWLGVALQPLTKELADSLGLKSEDGALLASVQPDSPAAKAGLKPGDVVVKADGKPVKATRDLARAVGSVKPGTKVDLAVWREGRERDITVTVAEPPGEGKGGRVARAGGHSEEVSGLKLAALDDTWRRRLNLDEDVTGVVVVDADNRLDGVRRGDLIQSVNNEPVSSPSDVSKKIKAAEASGRKNALVQVRRGDATAFIAVPVKLG